MVYTAQRIFGGSGRKMLNRVLRELQEPDPGAGGGLLLLAVCTGGLLLLVQQARKRMSQPAECEGIDPRS